MFEEGKSVKHPSHVDLGSVLAIEHGFLLGYLVHHSLGVIEAESASRPFEREAKMGKHDLYADQSRRGAISVVSTLG